MPHGYTIADPPNKYDDLRSQYLPIEEGILMLDYYYRPYNIYSKFQGLGLVYEGIKDHTEIEERIANIEINALMRLLLLYLSG
jgi:hypothetical protein